MSNKGFKNFGWANNSATKTQNTNTFTVGTGKGGNINGMEEFRF
jgi:hypothetical protein